jgi:tetratricopeptide (TPR) repeat protein
MFTAQPWHASAQTVTPQAAAGEIRIESIQGAVEINPGGNTQWRAVLPGQGLKPGDRVRTRERSRVLIRWSDRSVVRLAELSDVQIQAAAAKQRASFSLVTGILYFFNRERLTNARYGTRTASAAIRGTEFVLQAEENGRTTLTVVEGEVELSNDVDAITLRTDEQGIAEPGQAPRKIPAIIVNNVIQWALYYPAVLDVDELGLTLAERTRLASSTSAYKTGELLRALDLLPVAGPAESSPERIYRAGLLLAAGNVIEAEQVLATVGQAAGATTAAPRTLRLADALRQLIAAVKLQPWTTNATAELASEWLAQSYAHQSRGDLRNAIRAARRSVEISPDFGFSWARVAELEFSFGHTSEALDALERGLKYAPRNAQALALKGFVLAAQNRISEAISWFNRAITVDPNLANAWLGRGLCLIRQGHSERGRENLLTAVAMEPQRAILRSYLAKAYTDVGDEQRAAHELQIAKVLDENDPTAWLYSALLNEQENRINDAVRDLERSQELTGNRHIYRSGLLLDQDRAVRSANLARIYQDTGMSDVAIREASRAVSYDYANYSAHLFLANSYDQLRDPNRINLRYETPAEAEYLIANLLAPVGAGILSQTISQQEYSKLFERDRFGVASTTEYLSRGAWTQRGAQFGTYENSSYMFEGLYRSDPGQRRNNDFEETELRLHLKQELTSRDSIYLLGIHYDAEGGDRFQYFDPTLPYTNGGPNLRLRTRERQEPALTIGYHREWQPGCHTLLFAGRYEDVYEVTDPQSLILLRGEFLGDLGSVSYLTIGQRARTETELYATEAQQTWQSENHGVVAGLRFQWGDFEIRNLHHDPAEAAGIFREPPVPQYHDLRFERWSVYAYDGWRVLPPLQLVAGLSYDWMRFPENFRSAPMSDRHEELARVLPKAGFVWTPAAKTTVRGAYTRSIAGAGLDQSLRLEPTQVAGFNQAFRSLIPESVAGANAGARFETYDVLFEQKFGKGTYLGLGGYVRYSDVPRTRGAYTLDLNVSEFAFPTRITEELDYRERGFVFSVDQLLNDEWSLGASYNLNHARLRARFPEVRGETVSLPPFDADMRAEAVLHQVLVYTVFNHPSGIFARLQGGWSGQSNSGYTPDRSSDDFWQIDLFTGYRFLRRRAAITVGLLNITDQDYRLNPLTLHTDQPRERTLLARLELSF